MASSPNTIPFVPIKDFIDKWGWSEKLLRQFIASGAIKPSYAVSDRTNDYVYFRPHEPFLGPIELRTVSLSGYAKYAEISGEKNVGGVVTVGRKLFLQKPVLKGHNDCEFTLATFDPDPPIELYSEHNNYECSWVEVAEPITLSEVIENGFFSDEEIKRFGGLDELLAKLPSTSLASSGHGTGLISAQALRDIVFEQQVLEPNVELYVPDDALTVERLKTQRGLDYLKSIYGHCMLPPNQKATAVRNLLIIYGTKSAVAKILGCSDTALNGVLRRAKDREARERHAAKNAGKKYKL